METLTETYIPELGKRRQGKVRDIYEGQSTLTLIASDRVSIFDRVLSNSIRDKGRILTLLSMFWFEKTKDIISNHLVSHPDPNVLVVKKCQPIPVEMIVRGYLVGSLWRDYAKGIRSKCGVLLPEGLKENDPLPTPIVTPTTKSAGGHDEDITAHDLIAKRIVTKALWDRLSETALKLYERGQEIVGPRGLILVDTKYEFGHDDKGELVLIDEIHTPDSSRYWYKSDVQRNQIRFPDKEFIREWGRSQGFTGDGVVPSLPDEVIEQIRSSYANIYTSITGIFLCDEVYDIPKRLICNLRKEKLIRGLFCALLMRNQTVESILRENRIPFEHVDSAEQLNRSLEPVVWITDKVFPFKTPWPVIRLGPNPKQTAEEAIKQLKSMEIL